jgi:aspartate aminotransferase
MLTYSLIIHLSTKIALLLPFAFNLSAKICTFAPSNNYTSIMSVSKLAQNLHGSEIIKIAGEINELKRQGQNIANLTIGDFDSTIYPIPAELKQDIVEAYAQNQTNYPPADGMLNLRESVSAFLKSRFDLDYNPGQILISGGSRPLIYSIFMAVVDPGDKVVFPAPSWNNNHYCDLTGAEA